MTFWVSPKGNDAAPGTQSAPFRTLHRARDAVRSLTPRQRGDSDVVIQLRGGQYRLEETLLLDWRDSGRNGRDVVYRAAPGEYPVICGSIPIQNWALHDAGLNIWRAMAGPYETRQLYVNGQRATRAQTELQGGYLPAGFLPLPVKIGGTPYLIGGGIAYEVTPLNPVGWRDPTAWCNVTDVEAVIVTQWKMMRVPLAAVVPDPFIPNTGLITLQQPGWTNANVFFESSTDEPGIWSFWQVTRFENAREFLDEPGEWYLDETTGWLYYIPLPGEDMSTAEVELPLLEVLVEGQGELERPISNIRFEGLTFSHATWTNPSTGDGYVSDQSGFHLTGDTHVPNIIGHDENDTRTPGNVSFIFARNITFRGNIFEHLGAVGLDFDTGSQGNRITDNLFTDISSAAIQLGGIDEADHRPDSQKQITRDNVISNNLIRQVGREYIDAAGIYVGFTQRTVIRNNTIVDVPWSGIAVGWGWGLLDPGSFPGLPGATNNQWGAVTKPTPSRDNKIINNRFYSFLNVAWDGGAVYTTGHQGTSMANGLLIEGNVASDRNPALGGNIFYTDGGSRYIKLKNNVSYNNPIGFTDFGPDPQVGDPLPYSYIPPLPYGGDAGGCVTYGDIHYAGNYWMEGSIPADEAIINDLYEILPLFGFGPYSAEGFFDVCPYSQTNMIGTNVVVVSYPTRLTYADNHTIAGVTNVPKRILRDAGVRSRPATIPASKWVLPP